MSSIIEIFHPNPTVAVTRRRTLSLVLMMVCIAAVLQRAPPAEAACAAPNITVEPLSGSVGTKMSIRGSGFASECRDVITCEVGQPCTPPPPAPPSRGIMIELSQGERTWALGTVDASADYSFTINATVPGDARNGLAVIRTRNPQSYPDVGFTIASSPRPTELPRTGSSRTRTLLIFGFGLCLAGALVGRHRYRYRKADDLS